MHKASYDLYGPTCKRRAKKGMAHGVQIAGAEVTKLLKYLKYTGAVSSSVKDLFGSTDGLKRTSLKISKDL